MRNIFTNSYYNFNTMVYFGHVDWIIHVAMLARTQSTVCDNRWYIPGCLFKAKMIYNNLTSNISNNTWFVRNHIQHLSTLLMSIGCSGIQLRVHLNHQHMHLSFHPRNLGWIDWINIGTISTISLNYPRKTFQGIFANLFLVFDANFHIRYS